MTQWIKGNILITTLHATLSDVTGVTYKCYYMYLTLTNYFISNNIEL